MPLDSNRRALRRALREEVSWREATNRVITMMNPAEVDDELFGILISYYRNSRFVPFLRVVEVLTEREDPQALAERVLSSRADFLNKASAITSLASMDNRATVDGVNHMLSSEDTQVREDAVYCAGKLRDPRSSLLLIHSLQDVDAAVRVAAAEAIGDFADEESLDVLAVVTDDPRPDVQDLAWKALERYGGTATAKVHQLREKRNDRERALMQPDGVVSRFRASVPDSSWRVTFRRSALAPNIFHIYWYDDLFMRYCLVLGVPHSISSSMYSARTEMWAFLDGGLINVDPYGFASVRGTYIVGFHALRYICHAFQITPPTRLLKDEQAIPPVDALEQGINEAKNLDPVAQESRLMDLSRNFRG